MTESRLGITEGLLIAGVPVAGYWVAFLYELGYCTYFNIPLSFIEIGILNILVAIVGIAGVLLLISIHANMFYMLLSGIAQPISFSLLKIGTILILISGYALVSRLPFVLFVIIVAIIIVLFGFLEFIFPLLTQRKVTGYLNKLAAQEKTELEHKNIFNFVANSIGRKTVQIILVIFVLSFVAYFAGGYKAKTQRNFMVFVGNGEKVVLKAISGYLLVAEFDRPTKSLSSKFTLVSSEQPEFSFSYERIGPLVPGRLPVASSY